jgi:phage terminase large subunit-like protein
MKLDPQHRPRSPKDRKRRNSKPSRPPGRPRTKKPTGRVSYDRRASNVEAGRIRRAREKLKGQALVEPWSDASLSRLQKIVAFANALPVTKGLLHGEQMRLLDHQVEFLRMIYAADPMPKLAIQSLPRGNGKTGLLAALALCHLLGPESEPRGEIYSVATTRDQAGILFNEMAAIATSVPAISVRVAISLQRKRIEVLEVEGTGSIYESLAAEHSRGLGLAPTLWVYDELAAARDRRLLDALMTASGKRKNSLGIIISTQAENDDHPLSVLIDEALSGRAPNTVCQLMSAPVNSDPFDIKTIRACNPAAGIYLNESDLIAASEMAKRSYAFEPAYRNLRLNQRVRTDADARLVDAATWNRGTIPVNEQVLTGKDCTAGLDLAAKHDLTAFVASFQHPDGSHDVVCRFWTPEGQLEGRRPAERDLFEQWIRQGHLIAVPGEVIDPEWVVRELALLASRFRIQEIRYDKYGIADLKLAMTKAGVTLPLVEHQQGFVSMGPALSYLGDKLRAGQVRHGGHPGLTHCIGNAVVVADAADILKIHKGKSHSTS